MTGEPDRALLTPLFQPEGGPDWLNCWQKVPTHRERVEKAGDDGDKVRRALANIPVLTICDDHEVTDDWFITGAWRARVLGSTLGRAMIRNALLAYVLFQAWGNTPDAFATAGTPEAQLLALVPHCLPGPARRPTPVQPSRSTTCSGWTTRPAPARRPGWLSTTTSISQGSGSSCSTPGPTASTAPPTGRPACSPPRRSTTSCRSRSPTMCRCSSS